MKNCYIEQNLLLLVVRPNVGCCQLKHYYVLAIRTPHHLFYGSYWKVKTLPLHVVSIVNANTLKVEYVFIGRRSTRSSLFRESHTRTSSRPKYKHTRINTHTCMNTRMHTHTHARTHTHTHTHARARTHTQRISKISRFKAILVVVHI